MPIVSRFKILAKMDIAEKRVPQDGAIALKTGDKRIDLRVSTVPTVYGEKMVMRILDKGAIPIELTGLGFDERQSKDLIESIQMPHGLMLVTGPTGSGKSTTLYACLNLLNEPDTNICTVEDPVEYKFKGMNQVQVKSQVGLTFAGALRAFLRQDPDVIMVGEVRDQETAQICLRAALTGHFVLSTIHTNDSLSAVNRLEDMGIEPFLLASTLRVLEAQRLIRRLCKECKEPYECDAETAERHGLEAGQTLYRPKGCDHCRGAGYRGRVGVFEVVRITARMAALIQTRAPLPELRAAAREQGMKLLVDSGMDKVRARLDQLGGSAERDDDQRGVEPWITAALPTLPTRALLLQGDAHDLARGNPRRSPFLRHQLGRRGPRRAESRAPSGSPVRVSFSLERPRRRARRAASWDGSPTAKADESGTRIGIEFQEAIRESTQPELTRRLQNL